MTVTSDGIFQLSGCGGFCFLDNLDCVTMQVCVVEGGRVPVCVSTLVGLCPLELLAAADRHQGGAMCQVSFILPVSVDDQLVPQVFNVTSSSRRHTDQDRQTDGKLTFHGSHSTSNQMTGHFSQQSAT